MKIKKLSILLAVALALAMIGTPALAGEELLDDGETTVTWDSSFFTVNLSDTVVVTWTVTPGTASYSGWRPRGFTPKGKDPALGNVTPTGSDPGSATFSVEFTDLHLALDDSVEIGNAHFTVYLDVVDVDGEIQTIGCGVNVHIEKPL